MPGPDRPTETRREPRNVSHVAAERGGTVLDSFARASEAAWLDESIPALRGLTPRQAAADPTRRDDLVRLLEEFAGFTGPGMMDVGRLRDALGV